MKRIFYIILPIIILIILLLIFFYKIIFQNKIFLFGDAYYYYSCRALIFNSLKNSYLPFWTPYLNCGFPLMANPEAGVFDPLNVLLLYFFGPVRGFNYLILSYFFMAGIFTFFYCRSLNLNPLACLFSAIVYVFGGAFLGRLVHLTMIFSASFLPLIFWMVNLYFKTGGVKYLFLTGLAMGWSFLPGHPQIALYASFASILYFLSQVLFYAKDAVSKKIMNCLFGIMIILITAVGVSALQSIPTFEFTKLSDRFAKLDYYHASNISFSPKHLLTNVFPYFYGIGVSSGNNVYWGKGSFWELHIYTGILPLFFLVVALKSFRKDKKIGYFAFLWLLALLLALGKNTPIFFIFYKLIPVFRYFKDPCRFIFIVSFATSILCGLGLNLIISDKKFLVKFLKGVSKIFFLLFIILTVLSYNFYRDALKRCNLPVFYWLLPAVFFTCTVLLLFLIRVNRINRWQFCSATIVITLFDLFIINYSQNLPQEASIVTMEPKSVKFLKKDKTLFRVFNIGADFPYSGQIHQERMKVPFYAIYGIQSANLSGPLYLLDYQNLVINIEDEIRLHKGGAFSIDDKLSLLSLLNVKYIVSSLALETGQLNLIFKDDRVRIYENPDVSKRAFFLPKESESEVASEIQIKEYKNNKVILEVSTNKPGFVVLNDTYYPGWKVFINRLRKPLLKKNFLMRAVFIEEGRHNIEFVYDFPASVKIGLLITFISLIVVIVFTTLEIPVPLQSPFVTGPVPQEKSFLTWFTFKGIQEKNSSCK